MTLPIQQEGKRRLLRVWQYGEWWAADLRYRGKFYRAVGPDKYRALWNLVKYLMGYEKRGKNGQTRIKEQAGKGYSSGTLSNRFNG